MSLSVFGQTSEKLTAVVHPVLSRVGYVRDRPTLGRSESTDVRRQRDGPTFDDSETARRSTTARRPGVPVPSRDSRKLFKNTSGTVIQHLSPRSRVEHSSERRLRAVFDRTTLERERRCSTHRNTTMYLPHRNTTMYLPHRNTTMYLPHRNTTMYPPHRNISMKAEEIDDRGHTTDLGESSHDRRPSYPQRSCA